MLNHFAVSLVVTNEMRTKITTYGEPFVGCMVGSAFQKMIVRLDEALSEAGLDISSAEYMILRALFSHDGLQQCELADMVGKDKASVSRTVATLVKKGLIRREQVSYKCCKAWLTDEGEALRALLIEIGRKRHQALARGVTVQDLEAFVRVLEAILNE